MDPLINKKFIKACKKGYIHSVASIVNSNPNLNLNIGIMMACYNSQRKVAQYLIGMGGEVTYDCLFIDITKCIKLTCKNSRNKNYFSRKILELIMTQLELKHDKTIIFESCLSRLDFYDHDGPLARYLIARYGSILPDPSVLYIRYICYLETIKYISRYADVPKNSCILDRIKPYPYLLNHKTTIDIIIWFLEHGQTISDEFCMEIFRSSEQTRLIEYILNNCLYPVDGKYYILGNPELTIRIMRHGRRYITELLINSNIDLHLVNNEGQNCMMERLYTYASCEMYLYRLVCRGVNPWDICMPYSNSMPNNEVDLLLACCVKPYMYSINHRLKLWKHDKHPVQVFSRVLDKCVSKYSHTNFTLDYIIHDCTEPIPPDTYQ